MSSASSAPFADEPWVQFGLYNVDVHDVLEYGMNCLTVDTRSSTYYPGFYFSLSNVTEEEYKITTDTSLKFRWTAAVKGGRQFDTTIPGRALVYWEDGPKSAADVRFDAMADIGANNAAEIVHGASPITTKWANNDLGSLAENVEWVVISLVRKGLLEIVPPESIETAFQKLVLEPKQ